MHHFTGTLTQPFGEHDDTCPGCALQDLAGALETALSAFYKVDAPACARLCDEVLDTSGALLGRVRIWVENRKGNDG